MSAQLDHIGLLARYNELLNNRVYVAAAKLSAAELALDRKAFFGSIIGTLNHLVVTDIIWLKRFANHPSKPNALEVVRQLPMPTALSQILFTDLAELRAHRQMLDWAILAWTAETTDADLEQALDYANTKGKAFRRRYSTLIVHLFNHQTHHRGQASTLLMQAGQDIGVTDLLELIPVLP